MSQDARIGSSMDELTTSKVKEEWQNSLLSLAYVNHMQTILFKYQLSESKAGIKVAGRNIKTFRYIDGNTKPNRKWRGNKEPFHEGEWEEWKTVLKTLHSQKQR